MKRLVLAIALVLALVVPSFADEAVQYASGPYVLGQIGAYGPDPGRFSGYDPEAGIAGNLIVGYQFDPMWSVQGEIGYLETNGISGFEFDAMPVTAAVRLGLGVGVFEPYLLAGGGAYFCKTVARTDAEPLDEVRMGGYFGVGALLHIKKFMIGVETRYLMLDIEAAPNDGMLVYATVGYGY